MMKGKYGTLHELCVSRVSLVVIIQSGVDDLLTPDLPAASLQGRPSAHVSPLD